MKTGEACIRNVACIESDATIREAARRMRLHNVGDLVVLGIGRERSIPVGIITDRDLVVSVIAFQPHMEVRYRA